jgi:hypothetical protein
MPATPLLLGHYVTMAGLHGWTGFVGKVALLACLLLLSRIRGEAPIKLVSMVIAAQCAAFALLVLGEQVQLQLVTLAGIMLGASALIVVAKPEGALRAFPERGSFAKFVVFLAWVWVFWYPVFNYPRTPGEIIGAIFYSPTGAIPHPTLLAALILSWSSWPNTPRLFGWAAVVASLIVGIADLAFAGITHSAVLILGAALVAIKMLSSAVKVGLTEDDRPPVDKVAAAPKKRKGPAAEPDGPRRVWKLK